MKLEIAFLIVVVNHARVYGSGMADQILNKSRNARSGDGSNTALGERQWDQGYTRTRTRVSKIGIYVNVNHKACVESLHSTDLPLAHGAQLGKLFLLHKVLPTHQLGHRL